MTYSLSCTVLSLLDAPKRGTSLYSTVRLTQAAGRGLHTITPWPSLAFWVAPTLTWRRITIHRSWSTVRAPFRISPCWRANPFARQARGGILLLCRWPPEDVRQGSLQSLNAAIHQNLRLECQQERVAKLDGSAKHRLSTLATVETTRGEACRLNWLLL